ncbi:uncharacterized protein LOC117207805 [Bombus bifarius]|uniref:Uncharacterized protein LOC117207805 n=1 Tax=Bombus bifarius TaxID=103933 RepID=A0A6P8MPK2_9HYME|nr:uncharacterized protein LOC117207805 [Bombus bifarius]
MHHVTRSFLNSPSSSWVAAVGHAGMTNNTLYRCSVCGRTYSRKTSYHRHLGEKCGKHRRVESVKTASTAWKRKKRTRLEEGPQSCQLRHSVYLLQVWQTLHMDGLLDQTSSRRLRKVT